MGKNIMDFISSIILLSFLLVAIFDALRDAWIKRRENISYKKWHWVKRVAYYVPLFINTVFYFYLGFTWLKLICFLMICIFSIIMWRFTYLLAGGLFDRVRYKGILPTVDKAGAIAVSLSEHLAEQEQAFFVAGFQECVKYLIDKNR